MESITFRNFWKWHQSDWFQTVPNATQGRTGCTLRHNWNCFVTFLFDDEKKESDAHRHTKEWSSMTMQRPKRHISIKTNVNALNGDPIRSWHRTLDMNWEKNRKQIVLSSIGRWCRLRHHYRVPFVYHSFQWKLKKERKKNEMHSELNVILFLEVIKNAFNRATKIFWNFLKSRG